MKLPIKPVSQIERTSSYAFYGRAGTGKTTLSSTFPKPILLLDINDRGTDSVADIKQLDVMEINGLEDIEDVYYFLKDSQHKYKTVVFDTATEMQKIIMRHVIEGKKKSSDRLGDWGTMAKRDWGDVAAIMNKWITDFRDLDLEVVFLCQERVRQDESDNDDNQLAPEVGPAVMPSIALTLNAAVNVIGNTFIKGRRNTKVIKGKKVTSEETVYCLRVGPNPTYITKLRKPRKSEAPAYIEDPTYEDIRSVIKGEE